MVAVLDELQLTELVTSIHGFSAVGAAAILAETGDPRRFDTARAVVKHAGLAPREKLSGTFTGRTKLTGQGRPRLRVAAWRAVWGCTADQHRLRRPLPTPDHPRAQQAQTHPGPDRDRRRDPAPLHAVVTTGQAWDPQIAAHGTNTRPPSPSPPEHQRPGGPNELTVGASPPRHRGPTGYLVAHHGQPRPSSTQPDHTLQGTSPDYRYAGTDDGRGTDQTLDAKRLTLMVGRYAPAAAWSDATQRGLSAAPWGQTPSAYAKMLQEATPYEPRWWQPMSGRPTSIAAGPFATTGSVGGTVKRHVRGLDPARLP